MDVFTLKRLRLAFALLGLTLLAALFLLVRSAQVRLEAQRRLRHQIVAERIFDEMERELTALLQLEGARPNSAYDSKSSRSETWAPFVVGYFTRDVNATRVIARDQLTATRAALVERAAALSWRDSAPELREAPAAPTDAESLAPALSAPRRSSAAASASAPVKASAAKQDAILRKLNRGAEQRPQKEAKKSKSSRDDDDPLQGLQE